MDPITAPTSEPSTEAPAPAAAPESLDDRIAAHMAKYEGPKPDGEDEGEAKKADAAAEPTSEKKDEADKPAAAAEDEEKKSWQAKMKAEVKERDERLAASEARDRDWQQAATKLLVEYRALEGEVAELRERLASAGVREDPATSEIRQLRRELDALKSGQGLDQRRAQVEAQIAAERHATEIKTQVRTEATALMGKHTELKDPAIAEELLLGWSAACATAERLGRQPPAMTAYVERQLAVLRHEQQQKQIEAKRAQLDKSRTIPRTLTGNGSSGHPAKFPATDEGIEAWAKSRGLAE